MNLITDRTESDALLGNEKGTYSFEDLNRVEGAVAQLTSHFIVLDIGLNLEIKTDWKLPGAFSAAEWPVASQMQRYLGNVAAIKDAFGIPVQLPASMVRLTWSGANNIEKVLQMAMTRATNTIQTFRYSGETYSGEE